MLEKDLLQKPNYVIFDEFVYSYRKKFEQTIPIYGYSYDDRRKTQPN
jgi:hypothetical protein